MDLTRRDFMLLAAMGAGGAALPAASRAGALREADSGTPHAGTADPDPAVAGAAAGEQQLHPDFRTQREGLAWHVLGNGRLLLALQESAIAGHGTHGGLFLMSPEHFARKASTFLFHPERGTQNTRLYLNAEGKDYAVQHGASSVARETVDGVPSLRMEWEAGDLRVTEQFTMPAASAQLLRRVTVRNAGAASVAAKARVLLYPNLLLFDEYEADRSRGVLTASGYGTLRLIAPTAESTGDRHVNLDFGTLRPGAEAAHSVVYAWRERSGTAPSPVLRLPARDAVEYWKRAVVMRSGHAALDGMFAASVSSLRAAVAASGKMDASIWQYNFEWVRDMSMVAIAAAQCGLADVAAAMLERMLSRHVDERGFTIDASRKRPPELVELDQNGQLLTALWTHWMWSGDAALLRRWSAQLRALADLLLDPAFRDASCGLLRNSREYWERQPSHGIEPGYENTYQLWAILGLRCAADMADAAGCGARATGWRAASEEIRQAFLSHPTHSFARAGGLVKRLRLDGSVQEFCLPPDRAALPDGVPLRVEAKPRLDPDTSSVHPLVYGVVDAAGVVGRATLASMEELWNQRWSGGGYGRYNVSSEPDSPGAWPFASMFIARAFLEAGDGAAALRVIDWMASLPGGHAGSWLEFYGERPTPPLPPVGIVPWTWAEIISFSVHHLLGIRPQERQLMLRPRLLPGMSDVSARLRLRGHTVELRITRGAGVPTLRAGATTMAAENGEFELAYPAKDCVIDVTVK